MIELFQYSTAFGLPSLSLFCMKVGVFMKLAGLEHRVVTLNNALKAPKGKLPFIDDDGHVVADSGFIIDYLHERYDLSLDDHLDDDERARCHAIRRMVEEHLYFVLSYSRWADDEGFRLFGDVYARVAPTLLRPILKVALRKVVLKQLHQQGIGRHNSAEAYRLGGEDLEALSRLLGERPYFSGEAPTTIDATTYACLANIIDVPLQSPLRITAESHENLLAYSLRMKQRVG